MRNYVVGVVALAALAVCVTTGIVPSAPTAATGATTFRLERDARSLRSGRVGRAVVRGGHAAWYVGSTSSGTQIDFRLSPSGLSVRDFHFGPQAPACATLVDGRFPLDGLRVSNGAFHGDLYPADDSPDTADQPVIAVSGRFTDPQHVTGTVQGLTRGCDTALATFTATSAGSLPARPTSGGSYVEQLAGSPGVQFRVSRTGRRVTAFRIATVMTFCKDTDRAFLVRLTHSYPIAGLRQNHDGVFAGVLSSRLNARGRPAGTLVRVTVLFLSPSEATGTFRLLSGGTLLRRSAGPDSPPCRVHATVAWRATLVG